MRYFSTQRSLFFCLFLSLFSILGGFSQTGYDNQILPVGGFKALMANTGTAGLNSVGAIYYNSAALTQLEDNSLKVSGATYTGYRFKATPLFEAEGANLDHEGSSSTSTPSGAGVRLCPIFEHKRMLALEVTMPPPNHSPTSFVPTYCVATL